MSKKIAINGFGRIGRTFLRTVFADQHASKSLQIVAINVGPCSPHNIAHLFKYDSLMGTFPGDVHGTDSTLTINGHTIQIIGESNPSCAKWGNLGIDWVIEASGCFTQRDKAALHLQAGAKKVLITAPATDEDITIIPGVNDTAYKADQHHIISLGSCTTNCFAPIVKVLHESFGIQNGMMSTIHAYTNDQVLLDVEHSDPRRARAAALNIIPTKTGAAETILKLFPQLKDKLFASSLRVPVPKVSVVDFTFVASKNITKESLNKAFQVASQQPHFKNILAYTEEPLVSSDYNNSPYSVIIDGPLTQAAQSTGKVFGWYDNEWGYSCRLKDFLLHNP